MLFIIAIFYQVQYAINFEMNKYSAYHSKGKSCEMMTFCPDFRGVKMGGYVQHIPYEKRCHAHLKVE